MTPRIAYFSMEIGLDPRIPTYAGGLGILAGDVLKAAADLDLPLVGISLLHRQGYFRQRLDRQGNQQEVPANWSPELLLEPLDQRVSLELEGRRVQVGAWRYSLRGVSGHRLSVYFLDTRLPENSPEDRALSDHLYGGDERYRLRQEAVLGLGGMAMLRALGHDGIETFHMNEGHCALLALDLVTQLGSSNGGVDVAVLEQTRKRCVFTTHTPVAAGHDAFPTPLVEQVLGAPSARLLSGLDGGANGHLNMTALALNTSRWVNGVALRHRQVAAELYPDRTVHGITNGVHAASWTAAPFAHLYDQLIPGWRGESLRLRNAIGIPLERIRSAHDECKGRLFAEIERRSGQRLDPGVLTLGFARRAATYKRADLLLDDPARLRRIASDVGPLQVVYAGKAHPRDEAGKQMIRRVVQGSGELADCIRVVYLEDYDMRLGLLLCSGVDLWLNTPHRPLEASGTSGMKAALNGVPSLSVLDGWWVEGHVEGVTGWSIGETWEGESDRDAEREALYAKLETTVLPLYYGSAEAWTRVMRSSIAINGSFFNAQRMVQQYLHAAWLGRD